MYHLPKKNQRKAEYIQQTRCHTSALAIVQPRIMAKENQPKNSQTARQNTKGELHEALESLIEKDSFRPF